MRVLFLGGTRFFGIEAVNALVRPGHEVAIATRGRAKDDFHNEVERIKINRTNVKSIARGLRGRHFDTVYDNIVYSSNDVRILLDNISFSEDTRYALPHRHRYMRAAA